MAAGPVPLEGEELLTAVADAMVDLHERYHGRRPARGKAIMLGDDLIACVLGDVYTDVEKTMIELQRVAVVQETRSDFQDVMQRRFIDVVEGLTGRRVIAFISNSHVGPDVEVELFMLDGAGTVPAPRSHRS